MSGFFSSSELVQSKPPLPTIAQCGVCGLLNGCISPKMKPTGEGRHKVLIVGECPGKTEDERGTQFVGDSGQDLRRILRSIGIDLDRDCVKTNSNICRTPNNRTPTDKEVEYCHPYLTKTIDIFKPNVIIPLGGTAVRSVLMGLWKEDPGEMGKWAGLKIPEQTTNIWICPTWHPSYFTRSKDPVIEMQMKEHLDAAFALAHSRPWTTIPDWRSQIRLIKDHKEAADILRKMTASGSCISFDFETNTLRPENKGAAIISCAVCWRGQRTIAYPWYGDAVTATRDLLTSNCPKIGFNIKFETRWFVKEFGVPIRHWALDGQIAVHCETSKRGTNSLKFQLFTKFGLPAYDTHIEQFLKSKGSSPINSIMEDVGMDDLLTYNGVDAVGEFKLGEKVANEYGYAEIPKYE